ncbi:MAG: peptidoglycan editing factor PgeF [Gammaproteobacteria bacterium]|nr:peptidoglycan editing factor PgeF [Gammaproteobacteria bacterium]
MIATSYPVSYLPVLWPDNKLCKPEAVHALTTLINGGVSQRGYSSFNLAAHVGDDPEAVKTNRLRLMNELQLPAEPVWLDQVHSNTVIHADAIEVSDLRPVAADASVSSTPGVVCAVLTADCLPVFFCDQSASEVAVAHAGWRGLHAGILSKTIEAMSSPVEQLIANLGPAIGAQSFEVGEDVYQAFADKHANNKTAFVSNRKGHYLCDIYQLAKLELQALGIRQISGGQHCTYSEKEKFYSYRRQPETGRMASLIWLSQS